MPTTSSYWPFYNIFIVIVMTLTTDKESSYSPNLQLCHLIMTPSITHVILSISSQNRILFVNCITFVTVIALSGLGFRCSIVKFKPRDKFQLAAVSWNFSLSIVLKFIMEKSRSEKYEKFGLEKGRKKILSKSRSRDFKILSLGHSFVLETKEDKVSVLVTRV